MSLLNSKSEKLIVFVENLRYIADLDIKQITERPELGIFNFKHLTPLLTESVEIARDMLEFPLRRLPEGMIVIFEGAINNFLNAVRQMREFSLVSGKQPSNLEERHRQVIQYVESELSNFFQVVVPYYSFLKLHSKSFQESMQPSMQLFQQKVQEIDAIVETTKNIAKEADKAKEEVQFALVAAKKAVTESGIVHHAQDFEKRAEQHRSSAKNWLIVTWLMVIAIACVSISFVFYFLPPENQSGPAAAQRIITKLVFLSSLYFGVLTASRNYRAQRHLTVVNEHRATALQTFETFVAGAKDDVTKNAVLLEATKCIFAPVSSGYLGNEEDNPQNRIIEVLKLVSPSSGKS